MKRSRKMTLALFVAVGIVGLLLIVGSLNIGGDLVKREASQAAATIMGADLAIDSVMGNPLRGYKLYGLHLRKGENVLFSAESIGVKINLMSVLSKNPRLSQVTIEGIMADADLLAKEIASMKVEAGGGEIPVEEVALKGGAVRSPWGETSITKASISLGRESIKTFLDIAMNSVPVKGDIALKRTEKGLDLKDLDLRVGDGKVKVNGSVMPTLSLKGDLNKLNVAQIVHLWPVLPMDSYDGTLSVRFSANGTWDNPQLQGHLSFAGASLAGYPVQEVESDLKYENFRLDLDNLKGAVFALPLQGRATAAFAPGKVPSLDLALRGEKASLANLRDKFPALTSVKGTVDSFSVSLKGSVTALSGNIDLKASQIEVYGQDLRNNMLTVVFKDSTATVNGTSMLDKGALSLKGTVAQIQKDPLLNINVAARSLDIGKIAASFPKPPKVKPIGDVSGDVTVKGRMAQPRLEGSVWSNHIAVGEEAMDDLALAFIFQNDTLSVSTAKGRWRGIPLVGRGAVAHISQPSPSLDLVFEVPNVEPQVLESFVPVLKEYELRGSVTGTAHVSGTLSTPGVQMSLRSTRLGFMGQGYVANMDMGTAFTFKDGVPKEVGLNLSAGAMGFAGIGAEKISARIDVSQERISLTQARATLGAGEVSGSGTVKIKPKEPADVDLSFAVKNGDLGVLARAGKLSYPMSGTLDGSITLKGRSDNPSISVDMNSPRIAFSGLSFTNMTGSLVGNVEKLTLKNFNAAVGGGSLTASGAFYLKKETPAAEIVLDGKGLDIASLSSGFPEAVAYKPTGSFSVKFDGTISGSTSSGKGTLSSPACSIAGIKFDDISYPFILKGMTLFFPEGRVRLYGGAATGKGEVDFSKGFFSKTVSMENVDVDPLLQDATGGLKGHIQGKVKGSAAISGTFGKKFSLNGKGEMRMGEGAITDFKAVKVGAALYGLSSIRFVSVVAPFKLETHRILLDNAKATAVEGDPIYRFIKASGPIGFDTSLGLQCSGNANIQVLNALFGGVAGVLGAGSGKSLEDVVRGALSGAKTGLEKPDFRDVSFYVGGTIADPSFSSVKIAPAPQGAQQQVPQKAPVEQTAPTPSQEEPTEQQPAEKEQKPEKLLEEAIQEGLKNILKLN
ncbi:MULTISPECIES: hypothetical protein [Aminobacterium]|uniref:hypothetical protein n=1 Tax=Aminobacterium TaxID=81466 RepID=UPI00257A829F|nr:MULTISPECIES: hypothetical protein [unclassified Aminobacterium]